VNYNQPNPAQNDISNWLIQNPQRLNLARIGFSFLNNSNGDEMKGMTEEDLQDKTQELDLWTGKITSSFQYNNTSIHVETFADPESESLGVVAESELLMSGSLGIFIDFPLPTRNKFDAPFVGVFNATSEHRTTLRAEKGKGSAIIRHDLDETSYQVSISWGGSEAEMVGPVKKETHRYLLRPLLTKGKKSNSKRISLAVTFAPSGSPITAKISQVPSSLAVARIEKASSRSWEDFWNSGAFVDLSTAIAANSTAAKEFQRRIILSQYLTAVNSASRYPPQGKYHASTASDLL
jgi:trehalose/maltose hydrolase-like predicted phosphorylase